MEEKCMLNTDENRKIIGDLKKELVDLGFLVSSEIEESRIWVSVRENSTVGKIERCAPVVLNVTQRISGKVEIVVSDAMVDLIPDHRSITNNLDLADIVNQFKEYILN